MNPGNFPYKAPEIFIDGQWRTGGNGSCGVVRNPATGAVLAQVPRASIADMDEALASSAKGFERWRRTSALDRGAVLRRAADLLRQRSADLAQIMTLEQGKTLAESKLEFSIAAETFEWFAAEGLRAYGRIIPARLPGARQMVQLQPIGPVAALSPWNFPAALPARKIAGAIAAGCSVVIKPAEETPGSAVALVQALADAGLPDGVINLLFGVPSEVSEHLIRSEVIRKVHFTGSTAVGRHLASLAAEGVKPCTLELGGHAPVLIFNDADLDRTIAMCVSGKLRNAGQVCTSPTRFIVQDGIHDVFVERLAEELNKVVVGPGLDPRSQMGAMANPRRITAMEELTADAVAKGATLKAGGARAQEQGNFWLPTLLSDVPASAFAMQVEPFGPMVLTSRFSSLEHGLEEANRLPYGLAAYAFTSAAATALAVSEELQAGAVGINTFAVSQIEAPFGGLKDSGYGTEGGREGLEAFMRPRYVHHLT